MNSAAADPLQSALRLFLSADIVGSTAFKQKLGAANQLATSNNWFLPIAGFYREIERLFAIEWQRYIKVQAQRHNWPFGAPPEMWKGVGDEVLYTKVLTDHREAMCCVQCWVRTINSYRLILRSKYPELDVKASAWLAGFPVTNSEIVFNRELDFDAVLSDDDDPVLMSLLRLKEYYEEPKGSFTKDFIGPSIDTGFRVSAFATPRKMTVSIELALMLTVVSQPSDFGLHKLEFHYDGRVYLKGVLGGSPYPLIWIDMADQTDELIIAEDALESRVKLPSNDVKVFAEEFIRRTPGLFIPYIESTSEVYFRTKPDGHDERLTELRRYLENETAKRKDEKAAQIEPDVSTLSIPKTLGSSEPSLDEEALEFAKLFEGASQRGENLLTGNRGR